MLPFALPRQQRASTALLASCSSACGGAATSWRFSRCTEALSQWRQRNKAVQLSGAGCSASPRWRRRRR